MGRNAWASHAYLTLFAKPRHERQVYRLIKRHRVTNIVEIGIGDGVRATRMIGTAKRFSPNAEISFVGIDLFEGRSTDSIQITLKQAHRMLSSFGRKIRLIPGDPLVALSRFANTLTETQLLFISSEVDATSLDDTWFYVPRMLAENAIVLREEGSGKTKSLRRIAPPELQEWADAAAKKQRSAA